MSTRSHSFFFRLFSLAIFWGMRDTNPCKGIERNTEYVRRRYLSGDELVRLTMALAEHPQVMTESTGEGEERRVVIMPRQ